MGENGRGRLGRERLCPFMHMAWLGIPHGMVFFSIYFFTDQN